jgi:protein TonB
MMASSASADSLEYYSSKSLRAIEAPAPEYPQHAEMSGIEGYTLVEFTVNPDGTVAEPAIRESSAYLFGRAAVDALENWKFEPVFAGGENAVPVRSVMRFSFVGQE